MPSELRSLLEHLEKSGFLKSGAKATDEDKAWAREQYAKSGMPDTTGRFTDNSKGEPGKPYVAPYVNKYGIPQFYDYGAKPGDKWSPNTPEARAEQRKIMGDTANAKHGENFYDFAAGAIGLDGQGPAGYVGDAVALAPIMYGMGSGALALAKSPSLALPMLRNGAVAQAVFSAAANTPSTVSGVVNGNMNGGEAFQNFTNGMPFAPFWNGSGWAKPNNGLQDASAFTDTTNPQFAQNSGGQGLDAGDFGRELLNTGMWGLMMGNTAVAGQRTTVPSTVSGRTSPRGGFIKLVGNDGNVIQKNLNLLNKDIAKSQRQVLNTGTGKAIPSLPDTVVAGQPISAADQAAVVKTQKAHTAWQDQSSGGINGGTGGSTSMQPVATSAQTAPTPQPVQAPQTAQPKSFDNATFLDYLAKAQDRPVVQDPTTGNQRMGSGRANLTSDQQAEFFAMARTPEGREAFRNAYVGDNGKPARFGYGRFDNRFAPSANTQGTFFDRIDHNAMNTAGRESARTAPDAGWFGSGPNSWWNDRMWGDIKGDPWTWTKRVGTGLGIGGGLLGTSYMMGGLGGAPQNENNNNGIVLREEELLEDPSVKKRKGR